jgi:Ca-activated chloride channel homolog
MNPSADLDEATLTRIAEQTGGRYFRARNTEELEEIYRTLDALEPVPAPDEVFRPVTALFYWPLGVALGLSMLLALAVAWPRRKDTP